MPPKITLQEFIEQLKLLKESYIQRGYNNYNTTEMQYYGQFVELSQTLFELENNVIIN